MGELEEKISALLSSPDGLEKVLSVARSLSGPDEGAPESNDKALFNSGSQDIKDESSKGGMPDLSGLAGLAGLGDMNPKTMNMVMKLITEYTAKDDNKTALLSSLKPYMRNERREKIDKAVQIAKLAHVAKTALGGFGGDGGV